MTFYEKYESRLDWAWLFILLSEPFLGIIILVWRKEVIEMLNEIPVKDDDA